MAFAHYFKKHRIAYFHRKVLGYLETAYHDIVEKYSGVTSYPTEWDMESLPIYVFWYQGWENMPDIVKASIDSIIRHKGKHEVHFLHKGNLSDYVVIPKSIMDKVDKGLIGYIHFSDIIRLSLLVKGGIWMDATVFLTEVLQLPNMSFYTIRRPEIKSTPHVGKQKLTSYFFATYPDNPLFLFARDFHLKYYVYEEALIDYFLMDYCFELCYRTCPAAKELLDRVPMNNVNVLFLLGKFNAKFDAEEFNQIRKGTRIFKLTYKTQINTDLKDTYYDYIVSSRL